MQLCVPLLLPTHLQAPSDFTQGEPFSEQCLHLYAVNHCGHGPPLFNALLGRVHRVHRLSTTYCALPRAWSFRVRRKNTTQVMPLLITLGPVGYGKLLFDVLSYGEQHTSPGVSPS
jgi:hypothetical protein